MNNSNKKSVTPKINPDEKPLPSKKQKSWHERRRALDLPRHSSNDRRSSVSQLLLWKSMMYRDLIRYATRSVISRKVTLPPKLPES